jgi:hypothetical protein
MATPAGGFGPLYLTEWESGEESRTHGLNPYADAGTAGFQKNFLDLVLECRKCITMRHQRLQEKQLL